MENDRKRDVAPLAVRMRPRTLDEVVGQAEAVGEGSWLRAAIENDTLSSVILFGPAGTGKTSLAHVIAESTRATFVEVSAIGGTVSDLRREIDAAEKRLVMGGLRTILFVDEIHRFNRSQQDALLHAVEDRLVVLVGATTENPFFEVNSALISRSRIVELHSLSDDEIAELVGRAVEDARGLAGCYALEEDATAAIVTLAGGDGRGALTTLELAAGMVAPGTKEAPVSITEAMVRAATLEALDDAARKFDRACTHAAEALGAHAEILTYQGYMPVRPAPADPALLAAAAALPGLSAQCAEPGMQNIASTDVGDLSQVMPVVNFTHGGTAGALHSADFAVTDVDKAYIAPAKMMALTAYHLLKDGAVLARRTMDGFTPVFTRESYIETVRRQG